MNTLKAEILQDILSKLNDYISSDTEIEDNPRDVAFTLWEVENVNGSITCNAYESKEWIKNHFDDLDEVVEQYQFETGELLNPFSSPESFQVIVAIEVTCGLINEVYQEKMTVNQLIKALRKLQKDMGWNWYDRNTYFS